MRRLGVFVVCATLASTRARADEPISLTVTGSAAPGFGSKVQEGDKPRDVPDAAALLEGQPGLRVRRLSGEGTFATLSIRGAASNQVGVVLAGVPLTGAADPSLDWATLPLWPGASARVHRTFAPAALGGGYLGGIVEISPVEVSRSGDRTEVYDALSSFGAYRVRLADARTIGSFQVATGLSYSRQEGDYRYFDPLLSSDVTRVNNRSAQGAALLHARGELDRWTLLFTGLASLRQDGVAGRFDYPLRGTKLDRDRELVSFEARRTDDAGRLLGRLWLRRDGRLFTAPMREYTLVAGSARTDVLGIGGAIGRSLRLDDLTLDGRVEPTFEASGGTTLEGGDAPDHRRGAVGLALDATLRTGPRWSWIAALRADARTDTGAESARQEVLPVAHLGVEWRALDFL
ncbi:MAG: Plug domain-containing protein, partial [Sandaracinaceae bacterium]|nr:Plug domain-containing protein [Sandaracinaceae bacterium]